MTSSKDTHLTTTYNATSVVATNAPDVAGEAQFSPPTKDDSVLVTPPTVPTL